MSNVVVRNRRRVNGRESNRMSIQQALEIIGMPAERVYCDHNRVSGWTNKGMSKTSHLCRYYRSFWERDEYELRDIVKEMKCAFRVRLKEVRHDFTENHEEAITLIGAYRHAVKLFRAHGVMT